MTNLQIFENNEFGQIRTISINGNPYFVGKDIANILGYSNTKDALISHVDNEDKETVQLSDIQEGRELTPPHMKGSKIVIINESGLYSLIFGSKLETAKKFKRWVTHEVLPSIREKGFYARNEHERILKVYLLEQATEWEKTFPDDYYIQLCRLWSQDLGSKPQFFGHLTNKYIYSLLPEGVLESLKENTPNGIRLHQTLSPEVGKKHLSQVIGQVTVLMQVSATKLEFENIFEQAFKGKPRQFNIFDNY